MNNRKNFTKPIIVSFLSFFLLGGCASTGYTDARQETKIVSYPEVGTTNTASYASDILLKGVMTIRDSLVVNESIGDVNYKIKVGKYPQLGINGATKFFSGAGVVKGKEAESIKALSLRGEKPRELCVITVLDNKFCYRVIYSIQNANVEGSNVVSKTLEYRGIVGKKIKLTYLESSFRYQEVTSSIPKQEIKSEVEFDLSVTRIIEYKGAKLEVIKANDNQITYKVIKNFAL